MTQKHAPAIPLGDRGERLCKALEWWSGVLLLYVFANMIAAIERSMERRER